MAAGEAVSRRLFFAFELDEASRDAVQRLVDRLSLDLESQRSGSKGRVKWVERENFHVTLRFLGATPEPRVNEVCALVDVPFESARFSLRFDRLGYFPDRGTPRAVWLGASEGAREAASVQQELEGRLRCLGIPAEDRPFRTHLTLGRFRERSRSSDGRTIRQFAMEPFNPLLVDHITLYESHLSNRGPVYVAVRRVPLKEG